jgi:tRNA 5-methylaminomethyl-2-thiouridine biosynthesis bifunctional protein
VKTQPITPARIAFSEQANEPPHAPDFDDRYHPRIGAQAQARHVFLQGNGLPHRWAGRSDFTILETGFGLGHNFLATWRAWREDPQRCERLHFVSVELHPPTAQDLARALAGLPQADLAAQLLRAWPPLTPNLHRLAFEDGRLQLTLALGDAAELLPALRLAADAVFLDGFAPARNPRMWSLPLLKAVGRLCAPGATAATWSVARDLHEGLRTAGFEVQRASGIGGKREITLASHVPHRNAHRLPSPRVSSADAVVIGAGLAGAAAAQALARQGLQVTVLESGPAAALGASGNPAGLFHGTLDADDGPYARLYRSAALWAARRYREAIAAGVPGQVDGLLRLAPRAPPPGLPANYVRGLDREAASGLAGVSLPGHCWLYAEGGWIAPVDWVRHALQHPGITLRTARSVAHLTRDGSRWHLSDAQGQTLARSGLVVLAAAERSSALLQPLGHAPWPLGRARGQVSFLHSGLSPALQLPVAGDGYAIPLPDGLLCGATRQAGDEDAQVREADHAHNLERLYRLTGLEVGRQTSDWQGRVGWRVATEDRLPIAGAVPAPTGAAGINQARLLPREPGLFVLTGLGARGLSLAPLLGELVASQALGTPWPLEQDLVDLIDPGRWQVRSVRQASAQAG